MEERHSMVSGLFLMDTGRRVRCRLQLHRGKERWGHRSILGQYGSGTDGKKAGESIARAAFLPCITEAFPRYTCRLEQIFSLTSIH
ncbi:MAG TPA: hypothetical protein DCZ91_21390 [Lachnospiraceae bacterium]|nr:hypothetical protein [Lachnospiraceae bacterium]